MVKVKWTLADNEGKSEWSCSQFLDNDVPEVASMIFYLGGKLQSYSLLLPSPSLFCVCVGLGSASHSTFLHQTVTMYGVAGQGFIKNILLGGGGEASKLV